MGGGDFELGGSMGGTGLFYSRKKLSSLESAVKKATYMLVNEVSYIVV